MAKDPKGTDPRASGDPRPVYEPPQVLRLGEVHLGAGDCNFSGSGDVANCAENGNSAGLICGLAGNTASGGCSPLGSSH